LIDIITALSFFIGIILIGVLPFPFLYVFSNLFRFFLHKVFRYRRSVINDNLKKSLPHIDDKGRRHLVKLIYQNISDVFLEGVKAFTMSHKQIIKRHKILNPEAIEPYIKSGQSILGVTAHYANWEWGSLSASGQINAHVVAFYKKLNNSYIDRFVRSNRMKYGTTLASIEHTADTFDDYIGKGTVFVMAADQRTSKKMLKNAYWINFFNQETPFLYGPEKYAKRYNLPTFYIDIQRVRRGYYEVKLSPLVMDPSKLKNGELTKLYAQKLEEVITRKPQDWLWSHRRWKFSTKPNN